MRSALEFGISCSMRTVCTSEHNFGLSRVLIRLSQPGPWLIICDEIAPAVRSRLSSPRKERAMFTRRRFTHKKPLQERLLEEARNLREEAKLLPYGQLREAVLKKAPQAEVAAHGQTIGLPHPACSRRRRTIRPVQARRFQAARYGGLFPNTQARDQDLPFGCKTPLA